jgi:hypothetical protein
LINMTTLSASSEVATVTLVSGLQLGSDFAAAGAAPKKQTATIAANVRTRIDMSCSPSTVNNQKATRVVAATRLPVRTAIA